MGHLVYLTSDALTEHQIEKLYELYCETYGNIGETGNLMSEHDFKIKLLTEIDIIILQVSEVGEDEPIENCFLARQSAAGRKISYSFGDKKFAKGRVEVLTHLLKNDFYTMANGAPAKLLLKKDDIKISIEKESRHYYGYLGSHGKKLIFGDYKGGIEVTPNARLFYFYLYEYNKLKFKKDINEEQLVALYHEVSRESNIPKFYQLLLLSKFARKLCSINPDTRHIDKLVEINASITTHLINQDGREEFLIPLATLSSGEQTIITELLSEKQRVILEKGCTLFSNITTRPSSVASHITTNDPCSGKTTPASEDADDESNSITNR